MGAVHAFFTERLTEIDEYLDFLSAVDNELKSGPPKIGTQVISETQQRILLSSLYLQLYNLVEATISKCIEAISKAATDDSKRWIPADLSEEILREWVRFWAKTHSDLNYENRLNASLSMCQHLISSSPIECFEMDDGGGGNWDDDKIKKLSRRLGLSLQITDDTNRKVKEPLFNNEGALKKIRQLRNKLAHGNISFRECGESITVSDLRDIKDRTASYLEEVVCSFENYINSYCYLRAECRP